MPNRILREGLLESEAIDKLDAEAERFFVRLMLRADDFGRYHANPAMLANMLFPLRRDIEPQMIADWLNQCQRAKLLRVYHVDGRQCVEIQKFGQRSRAQQSKFPNPPTDDGQMTDICLTDDGHPRTYSYSDAYSSSSASSRAKAVSPPSLDEVIAEGAKRQIPADICQRWFNACEERPLTPEGGWTLRNGQPMNMEKWAASLANYASAFKSNEVAFGGSGKNGSKKQPSVWELQQRIDAAQKEVDRIQSNPSNKEAVPDSFDRRLKAEPMAQVKALKARIAEMRQELAGVERKAA